MRSASIPMSSWYNIGAKEGSQQQLAPLGLDCQNIFSHDLLVKLATEYRTAEIQQNNTERSSPNGKKNRNSVPRFIVNSILNI